MTSCSLDPNRLETLVRQAVAGTGVTVLGIGQRSDQSSDPSTDPLAAMFTQGSRRRRLWDLDGHAHCPVVGVCLPIAALRRLLNRVLGGQAVADDYELHCGVITECKLRTPISEAVQKELDRRYMPALRLAAKAKTTEALAVYWHEASAGKDLAGAFWAVLTHARCTSTLEHAVLGEVHMLQHQVGSATRADLARFEALIDENAVLSRALGAAQQRSTRQVAEHTRQAEQRQAELVRVRAELIGRDTALAMAREQLQSLEEAAPGLRSRFELAREEQRQGEQIHDLQRALLQSQQEAERQRRRADEAMLELQHRDTQRKVVTDPDDAMASHDGLAALQNRAVLCVGGRTAVVPVYRQLIERTGGRFMHHDGGEEDSAAKLDSTLAAADLVICQTGCISHDAYWRVKDHCKRTGKRCVFVDTPSRAGLERALNEVQGSATPEDA